VKFLSMYIRVTLCCRHLIILWLCHLGKLCSVFVFNLYCGGFILFCNVWVYVGVCMCVGGCVCVDIVMAEVLLNLWVDFVMTEVFLT
jgi:hypothetical protein